MVVVAKVAFLSGESGSEEACAPSDHVTLRV